MLHRLATSIREQLGALVAQYDERLRTVPGYATLPAAERYALEQAVLRLVAASVETSDEHHLLQYIHERAEEISTRGFQLEWFQQAVTILQDIIPPLVETIAESHFVWRLVNNAQAAAWQIVAQERRQMEMILRESEARYQTIFDSTPIMFWLKDTQNRTLRINKAAAAFEGVNPADVEGKSAYDLYPREQAEAFYQDDLSVIRSNRPKLGIVEQHTSVGTGKLMWVETGKTPVHNDQGETVGVLAFAIDITDRQQAADQLRESERQYREAITAAGAVPYYIDYSTESYRFIGEAIERLTGYRAEEMTPTLLGQMIQETVMTGQGYDLSRDQAIQKTRSGDLTAWNADCRLVDRAGQTHWLNDSSIQIHNDLGQAVGAIGILQDITERKQLEQHIQESLGRRGRQVQLSTEVAQEIASAIDEQELFRRVVTLIKERFNYYHAQLFRYDAAQNSVVLITGYGEIGQKMLQAGHKLQMGRGVVGTAAVSGKSILATDVAQDPDWRPNSNLPQTRGELAVPIKWRDEVLGILDVQSDRAGELTDDDRLLLEGLCGQIGTAMESHRLLDSVQQSEQLMRTLIDAIPDYIYAKDLQGRHILGNAALARLYGLGSPAELSGKTDFDFYPHELAVQYQASERPILDEGQSLLAHEEPNIGADGKQHWDLTTKVPLRDPQGQIIGLVGITSDITERKQVEEALRHSEAALSTALQIARLGYWEYDVEKDLFIFNDQFYAIFHTTAEQQGGYELSSAQYAQRFVYPDDLPIVGAEIERALKSTDRHYTRKLEHRILYADGGVGYISVNINIDRDERGRIERYYGANQDISERKRAEQRMEETLHETERLYAAVTHENWQTYRQTGQLGEGYTFSQNLLQPADKVWEPEIAQAVEQHALITSRSEQRAIAVSPLAVRGEAIGALGVYDDPSHPLSKEDLDLIETISEQVALALESARLFDQTQMALADTRALFHFSDLVSRETGIKSIYEGVAKLLVEEIGFAGAWIAQVDTQAQVLRGIAGAGLGMGPDRNFDVVPYEHMQTPATIAARDRVLIVVNDPLQDERLGDLPDQLKAVVGKAIAVPVIIDGEMESIIAATRPMDGIDISERDQRLLQTAAAQVAIALQRARLFEQTQRDAEREHTINRVTSRIRNARSVDEVLSIATQELRLATRASRSVVEILPDADQAIHAGHGEGAKA